MVWNWRKTDEESVENIENLMSNESRGPGGALLNYVVATRLKIMGVRRGFQGLETTIQRLVLFQPFLQQVDVVTSSCSGDTVLLFTCPLLLLAPSKPWKLHPTGCCPVLKALLAQSKPLSTVALKNMSSETRQLPSSSSVQSLSPNITLTHDHWEKP